MGVYERCDRSISDDLGSGARKDGPFGDLVEILGNANDPMRIVPREVRIEEVASNLFGDIGLGTNRLK
jgi:hypothetical protein